jgi:hypothetical protein
VTVDLHALTDEELLDGLLDVVDYREAVGATAAVNELRCRLAAGREAERKLDLEQRAWVAVRRQIMAERDAALARVEALRKALQGLGLAARVYARSPGGFGSSEQFTSAIDFASAALAADDATAKEEA